MPPKTTQKELEARLGFNSINALSRTTGVRKIPVLNKLLTGLTDIGCRYLGYGVRRIRTSVGIRQKATELFERLGPELWPGPQEPHPSWLFLHSRDSDHPGLKFYPKQLYYSQPDDRETLCDLFYTLVQAKVSTYNQNHRKNQPFPDEPSESDCLPNSEESEASEEDSCDLDDDDDDDEQEDDSSASNYSTSISKCAQRHENNLSSGDPEEMQHFRAPPAPKYSTQPRMGNAQARLEASLSEDLGAQPEITASNIGRDNHRRYGQQMNRSSAYTETTTPYPHSPASTSPIANTDRTPQATNQFAQSPVSHFEQHGHRKRPAVESHLDNRSKRFRTEDVSFPIPPRLVVVLKLTRDKEHAVTGSGRTEQNKISQKRRSAESQSSSPAGPLRPYGGKHRTGVQDLAYTLPDHEQAQTTRSDNEIVSRNPEKNLFVVSSHRTREGMQPSVRSLSPSNSIARRGSAQDDPQASQQTSRKSKAAAESTDLCGGGSTEPNNVTTSQQDQQGSAHPNSNPNEEYEEKKEQKPAYASASSSEADPLTSVWLTLYLPEQEDTMAGLVPLTNMTTRDALFAMMQNDLQDDLGPRDIIIKVKIERFDGQNFEGTTHSSILIKKNGHNLTWEILAEAMSKRGAGDGGLKGFVMVRQGADS
ncbi:hypothetical protein Q7P37_003071 [Cladosporium fusiforme]